MKIRKGIDISNWTGAPSVDQFRAIKELGFGWCIPGCQVESITRQQIKNLDTAGFEIPAVYQIFYFDTNDQWRMSVAASLMYPVYADFETPRPRDWDKLRLQEHMQSLIDKSYVEGVYARRSWWVENLGSGTEFAKDKKLWEAWYFNNQPELAWPGIRNPEIVQDFFTPYAGWSKPTIWQYFNKGYTDVNVDLNLWFADSSPVVEDKTIPAAEYAKLMEELADFRAFKQVIKEWANDRIGFVSVKDDDEGALTIEVRTNRNDPSPIKFKVPNP